MLILTCGGARQNWNMARMTTIMTDGTIGESSPPTQGQTDDAPEHRRRLQQPRGVQGKHHRDPSDAIVMSLSHETHSAASGLVRMHIRATCIQTAAEGLGPLLPPSYCSRRGLRCFTLIRRASMWVAFDVPS